MSYRRLAIRHTVTLNIRRGKIFDFLGAKDRAVKIWNYETNEIELAQNFEDDIHSVALHPTGLYCVIGFSDKLRYMTIMIDEIITTKEFNIRSCKLSRFSRMGHIFASTNGCIIQIYSSITFDLMYVLKGHNGKVKLLLQLIIHHDLYTN